LIASEVDQSNLTCCFAYSPIRGRAIEWLEDMWKSFGCYAFASVHHRELSDLPVPDQETPPTLHCAAYLNTATSFGVANCVLEQHQDELAKTILVPPHMDGR
jgi:hypothetical protein